MMKDLALICVTCAMFALGFFVVRGVDRFLAENPLPDEADALGPYHLLQLGAESTGLLNAVAPAMEVCTSADPGLEFAVTGGQSGRLVQKLRAGEVDLALLTQPPAGHPGRLAWLQLPARGCPYTVYVLWDPAVHSRLRDMLLDVLRTPQP